MRPDKSMQPGHRPLRVVYRKAAPPPGRLGNRQVLGTGPGGVPQPRVNKGRGANPNLIVGGLCRSPGGLWIPPSAMAVVVAGGDTTPPADPQTRDSGLAGRDGAATPRTTDRGSD